MKDVSSSGLNVWSEDDPLKCFRLNVNKSLANLVHHLCGPLRGPRAPTAFAGAAADKLRHWTECINVTDWQTPLDDIGKNENRSLEALLVVRPMRPTALNPPMLSVVSHHTPTIFKLGILMQEDDPHQQQALWPPRS